MRNRLVWLIVLVTAALGGFATWSWTRGQDPVRSGAAPRKSPASGTTTAERDDHLGEAGVATAPLVPDEGKKPAARDPSAQSPLQKQIHLSAQRGADWLFRMNNTDGRFVYVGNPALDQVVESDHFLHQAGAAFALARAARLTKESRFAARAAQAVMLLLADTSVDDKDANQRYCTLPMARLASAGLLVLAINELPAPQKDLLDQSEQLCNFIRHQQKADGSLVPGDLVEEEKSSFQETEATAYSAGQALCGLMRSQAHRPAKWKTEMVRKALAYYGPWWKAHKSLTCATWFTAAYTDAYLLTKEKTFAAAVFEMTDWICGQQYDRPDQRHLDWTGGFMSYQNGKAVATAPDIGASSVAEALVEGCRAARQAGDPKRFDRYRAAAEQALQFVTFLQYSPDNTGHFADWYLPKLLGGFHASRQDGNVRIDYTQHAVCAMARYWMQVVQTP